MAVEEGNIIVRSYNRLTEIILGKKNISGDNSLIENKKKDPILKTLLSRREIESLHRKMEDPNKSYNGGDVQSFLKDTSANTIEVIKRNNNLASLIPEITSAKNVWVTSIMSPTDLQTNSLSFVLNDTDIDQEAKTKIEEFFQNLFIKELKLEEKLIKAIEDCLFGSGSYPLLIIPQYNLDMLKYSVDLQQIGREGLHNPFISQESFNSSKNYFTSKNKDIEKKPILEQIIIFNKEYNSNMFIFNSIGEENFNLKSQIMDVLQEELSLNYEDTKKANESLGITQKVNTWFKENAKDKLVIAYNPTLINSKRKSVDDILSEMTSHFGIDKETAVQSYKSMFHSSLSTNQFEGGRKTVILGDANINDDKMPIVTHVPSDCVIPVGIGDEHVAYFILVDNWGTPMTRALMQGYDVKYSNSLIDLSVDAVYGANGPNQSSDIMKLNSLQKYNAAMTVFDVTLTKLLEDKLNDYGLSGMTVGRNQMIGKCIFHNLMQKKEVGLILVPKQLLTYYAMDYREDGTGKSLLENIEYVLSMRSTLLVSKILAMTRAAVEKTTIEVDMSKNANPLQTMRILQQAFFNKNKLELSNDLNTIVKNIYDSRVKFIPKNLKGAEDYSVQTTTEAPNTVRPDEDLLAYFDKLVISGLEVPASAIQETENTDYATSLVSKNLFFANVVRIKKDKILNHTEKHVKMFCLYCSYVKESIIDILKEYYYISEDPNKKELDVNISEVEEPEDNSSNNDKDKNKKQDVNDDTDDDIEPEYDKEKLSSFNNKIGESIGTDKKPISEKELNNIYLKIISNIKPTLPTTNVLKGKVQFEEVNSYIDSLDKYIETIYPESLSNSLPEDVKNYYVSLKAKIKADMLSIYKDKIGNQDLFSIPDITKIDVSFFTNLNQVLINNSKIIKDEIRVLTPVPSNDEDSGGGNAW